MLLQSDGRLPARIAAPKSVAEGPCQTMTNGITGAIQARVWSGIGVAIGLLIVVVAGATLLQTQLSALAAELAKLPDGGSCCGSR